MPTLAQFQHQGMPSVSVVIVNWNTLDFLRQALTSLYKETTTVSFETIVVDNGSNDGSASFVQREWPRVRLVVSPANVGFACGNNLGFRQSNGRYILLLNSDTIALPSTVSGMAGFLDNHPDTGCVGARHLNPDLTLQRSVGHYPSLIEDFLAYTELHRLPLMAPFLRRRFAYWGSYDRVREVDWVNGACMMVRREVLEQVGGLDEGYFLYAEELDWCYRIRQAGWRIYYTPDGEVIHFGGQSMNRAPDKRNVLKLTSQYRFYRKFYSNWRCFAWRVMVTIVAFLRIGLLLLLLIPLMAVRLKPNARHRWWEILMREPVVTHPIIPIRAWWRILFFALIDAGSTNIPSRYGPA